MIKKLGIIVLCLALFGCNRISEEFEEPSNQLPSSKPVMVKEVADYELPNDLANQFTQVSFVILGNNEASKSLFESFSTDYLGKSALTIAGTTYLSADEYLQASDDAYTDLPSVNTQKLFEDLERRGSNEFTIVYVTEPVQELNSIEVDRALVYRLLPEANQEQESRFVSSLVATGEPLLLMSDYDLDSTQEVILYSAQGKEIGEKQWNVLKQYVPTKLAAVLTEENLVESTEEAMSLDLNVCLNANVSVNTLCLLNQYEELVRKLRN